jgi:hypothetical protein
MDITLEDLDPLSDVQSHEQDSFIEDTVDVKEFTKQVFLMEETIEEQRSEI